MIRSTSAGKWDSGPRTTSRKRPRTDAGARRKIPSVRGNGMNPKNEPMQNRLRLPQTSSPAERQRRYIFFYTCVGYIAGIIWSFFFRRRAHDDFLQLDQRPAPRAPARADAPVPVAEDNDDEAHGAVSVHNTGGNIIRDDLRSTEQESHGESGDPRKHGAPGPAADDIDSLLLPDNTLSARRSEHRNIRPLHVPDGGGVSIRLPAHIRNRIPSDSGSWEHA